MTQLLAQKLGLEKPQPARNWSESVTLRQQSSPSPRQAKMAQGPMPHDSAQRKSVRKKPDVHSPAAPMLALQRSLVP
jgi:hypothetical protein